MTSRVPADPNPMQRSFRTGIALATVSLMAAGSGWSLPQATGKPAAAPSAGVPKPYTWEAESEPPVPLPELRRPAIPALRELGSAAVVQWTTRNHALVVSGSSGDPVLQVAARIALDAAATKALLQADRSPCAGGEGISRSGGLPPWIGDVGESCDAMAIVYALPGTRLLAVIGCVAAGPDGTQPVSTWTVLERNAATNDVTTLASAVVEHVSSPYFGVRVGDLDGNGSPDLLADWNSGGCGLAGQFSAMTAILTDAVEHRAAITELGWCCGLDVVTVRKPGVQILLRGFVRCNRCTDGKPHNFWTFNLVGFHNLRPIAMNDAAADLPRFEWLSFRHEDRNRALLTPAMRRALQGDWTPPKPR